MFTDSELDTSTTTVTAVVRPDYDPTPDLSKQFRGRRERGSEKKDWLACAGRSSDTNCNDPRTRPSAHAEDPIFAIAAHGSGGTGRAITRI
ncbi:hypothetical protein Taro_002359 [Colocasia esculenta]|uniref:Uncharacterized protein n=1 Tax=Colocasia esculenta TaxID=4460 RepID=A0A843TNE7_COLES|nr:hypothetical protein [Colocasia esculenta]